MSAYGVRHMRFGVLDAAQGGGKPGRGTARPYTVTVTQDGNGFEWFLCRGGRSRVRACLRPGPCATPPIPVRRTQRANTQSP